MSGQDRVIFINRDGHKVSNNFFEYSIDAFRHGPSRYVPLLHHSILRIGIKNIKLIAAKVNPGKSIKIGTFKCEAGTPPDEELGRFIPYHNALAHWINSDLTNAEAFTAIIKTEPISEIKQQLLKCISLLTYQGTNDQVHILKTVYLPILDLISAVKELEDILNQHYKALEQAKKRPAQNKEFIDEQCESLFKIMFTGRCAVQKIHDTKKTYHERADFRSIDELIKSFNWFLMLEQLILGDIPAPALSDTASSLSPRSDCPPSSSASSDQSFDQPIPQARPLKRSLYPSNFVMDYDPTLADSVPGCTKRRVAPYNSADLPGASHTNTQTMPVFGVFLAQQPHPSTTYQFVP